MTTRIKTNEGCTTAQISETDRGRKMIPEMVRHKMRRKRRKEKTEKDWRCK
jgi:hypothetical protein